MVYPDKIMLDRQREFTGFGYSENRIARKDFRPWKR